MSQSQILFKKEWLKSAFPDLFSLEGTRTARLLEKRLEGCVDPKVAIAKFLARQPGLILFGSMSIHLIDPSFTPADIDVCGDTALFFRCLRLLKKYFAVSFEEDEKKSAPVERGARRREDSGRGVNSAQKDGYGCVYRFTLSTRPTRNSPSKVVTHIDFLKTFKGMSFPYAHETSLVYVDGEFRPLSKYEWCDMMSVEQIAENIKRRKLTPLQNPMLKLTSLEGFKDSIIRVRKLYRKYVSRGFTIGSSDLDIFMRFCDGKSRDAELVEAFRQHSPNNDSSHLCEIVKEYLGADTYDEGERCMRCSDEVFPSQEHPFVMCMPSRFRGSSSRILPFCGKCVESHFADLRIDMIRVKQMLEGRQEEKEKEKEVEEEEEEEEEDE